MSFRNYIRQCRVEVSMQVIKNPITGEAVGNITGITV